MRSFLFWLAPCGGERLVDGMELEPDCVLAWLVLQKFSATHTEDFAVAGEAPAFVFIIVRGRVLNHFAAASWASAEVAF